MQAKNIQEFFGTLQQSTVEAWKKHLKVSKKSEHETLVPSAKNPPSSFSINCFNTILLSD